MGCFLDKRGPFAGFTSVVCSLHTSRVGAVCPESIPPQHMDLLYFSMLADFPLPAILDTSP